MPAFVQIDVQPTLTVLSLATVIPNMTVLQYSHDDQELELTRLPRI